MLTVQGVTVFTGRTLSGNIQCLWHGTWSQVHNMVVNQPVSGNRQLWWKGTVIMYSWMLLNSYRCTVWVKKNPPPPKKKIWNFFPNGWEFFVQILHACYTFLCTLNYTFLFTYLQLWRSYAILNVRTQFTSYVQMSTIGQTARWHFLTFFPYSWEFLVGILYVYYTFLSTLGFKFLFYYLQLWRSYAILSVTTKCAFRSMVDIFSM